MNHNPISISQAIVFATSTFKKRLGLFAAILLTLFGAWVTLEIVVIVGQPFGIVLWTVAHLIFLVFFAGIEVGFIQISLALYNGGEPIFTDTFRHLAWGPKFLAGQLIYLVMVLVGLVLLVVPGLYLSARYSLFGFSLVNDHSDLTHSFRQSTLLSAGIKTYLLAILISLVVLNVLGASLLGLGLLVTVPLSVLMLTAVYQQLRAR